MSGSYIFVEYYYLLFPEMVQVWGEFPETRLLAGYMGHSSITFSFGFLSFDVLAAFGLIRWSAARGGSVA